MKNYIKFALAFLKENKTFFLLALGYVFFCIVIFLIYPIPEDIKTILLKQTYQTIQHAASLGNTSLKLAGLIFLNNFLIAIIIFLTWFLLSLGWLLIGFVNVFVIGLVVTLWIDKIGIVKSVLALLPHWIFEITAILLSLWLSFKLTYLVIKKIWNWKSTKFWLEFKKMVLFFIGLVVPLLAIAALIESFITPLLIWKSI